jgi:hypothetical protein
VSGVFWPEQRVAVAGDTVITGKGIIVTVMGARSLSQPLTVWLTYQVVLPTIAVDGTGAVGEPTPPVAVVYQSRLRPVPVSADEVTFWQ